MRSRRGSIATSLPHRNRASRSQDAEKNSRESIDEIAIACAESFLTA